MAMFRRNVTQEPRGTAVLPAPQALACPLLRPFLKRVDKLQASSRVLLFGEMCGANVSYLGERGYRIAVEGVPPAPGAYAAVHSGALVWDLFCGMKPEAARQWIIRIAAGLVAGGAVLAFFPPAAGRTPCPRRRYRIVSEELVCPEILEGGGRISEPYPNRDIIKLFDGFDMDLLHTHRSGEREVLFFKGSA